MVNPLHYYYSVFYQKIKILYPELPRGSVLLILLFSLISFHDGQTQSINIDSLYNISISHPEDTVRVEACLELSKIYQRINVDSAILYAQQALELARKSNYTRGEILTLNRLGVIKKNYGKFEEALRFYRQGLRLSEQVNWKSKNAAFYNNLGNVFHRNLQYDSALIYLLKSIEIKKELDDKQGLSKSYNNLGNFYASREEDIASKNSYLQALKISEEIDSKYLTSLIHHSLGNAYNKLAQYDSAMIYYEQALEVKQKLQDKGAIAALLNNMGTIYEWRQNDEKALALYNQSMIIKREINNPDQLIVTYNNLGNLYRNNNEYNIATYYYNQGLVLAVENQLENRIRTLSLHLSECYEKLNDYRTSLSYLKRAQEIDSTLYNQEKLRAVKEIDIKYQTEKKTRESIQARAEAQQKNFERNTFIAATGFLAIILLIGIYFYLQKRRDNFLLNQQKTTIETREREKELLLRELHHRVKNNLQLVSSLLNLQAHQLADSPAASAVQDGQSRVEAMAIIHRDLYMKDDLTKVNMKTYLDKMTDNLVRSFGYGDQDITLIKEIASVDIDPDLAIPLGLIINELITNSLKYAFLQISDPILEIVSHREKDDLIYIKIRDNGPGNTTLTGSENGFGMDMVSALIKQISGSIEITNKEGYIVELRIPFLDRKLIHP
jgi:two-component sensor histidine kinase